MRDIRPSFGPYTGRAGPAGRRPADTRPVAAPPEEWRLPDGPGGDPPNDRNTPAEWDDDQREQ